MMIPLPAIDYKLCTFFLPILVIHLENSIIIINFFIFYRLSMSAIVMSYLQNAQPMTPPWSTAFG